MDKYHRSNPPTELKSVVMGRENSRKKSSISSPCSGPKKLEINQTLADRIIKRAKEGDFGLRDQSKPVDMSAYANMDSASLALCLVGAFHDKYDLVAVFQAAIEEITQGQNSQDQESR